MSMGGLFDIGGSAMRVAYTQLQTTGHNIANVNTPGYSRQEVTLLSRDGTQSGTGFVGRGVDVGSVVRAYDNFLVTELRASTSQAAGNEVRATELGRLEQLFANSDYGLGAAVDDMTAAFGDLVDRPFDASTRTAVLVRADGFAERVRSAADAMDSMVQDIDARLTAGVQSVNTVLTRIADLNDTIARGIASGHAPNDLMDQRDVLIQQVNEQIQTTSVENYDGTISLFTASGHGLVVGGSVAKFSLQTDRLDSSRLAVVLESGGKDIEMPASALGNGEMSGLLRFRDEDLASARANLGQIAAAYAWSVNEQQSLGRDPSGAAGAAIFSIGDPLVTKGGANTGTATFSAAIADGTALAASDYSIDFDGTNYTLTRLSDGTASTFASFPQTVDGLTIDATGGTAQAGDRFYVRAGSAYASNLQTTGIGQNRIATGMAATATVGAANAGDTTPRDFSVVSNDPNLTAPVTITFDGAGTFSVSGAGTGNPTGIAYTPGMTISYNGWSMRLTGTPGANDTIQVAPTADPSVDNRNARALLGLGDAKIVDGKRPSDAYANMLTDVGLRAQTARGLADMADQRLSDARTRVSEVSGVNLDEEAARLLQYQQAYQAAAKLMQTAQTLFETLLNMTN